MTRRLRPEERRDWAKVAATVEPAPGRAAPDVPEEPPAPGPLAPAAVPQAKPRKPSSPVRPPEAIEPKRRGRIAKERDPIDARIDLHAMDQDRARLALHDFLLRAHAEGARAVLVITGKGTTGEGVLRRRTPDWLAEPAVRPLIAGVSQAHRRHGGEGALYVALKRRR